MGSHRSVIRLLEILLLSSFAPTRLCLEEKGGDGSKTTTSRFANKRNATFHRRDTRRKVDRFDVGNFLWKSGRSFSLFLFDSFSFLSFFYFFFIFQRYLLASPVLIESCTFCSSLLYFFILSVTDIPTRYILFLSLSFYVLILYSF